MPRRTLAATVPPQRHRRKLIKGALAAAITPALAGAPFVNVLA